MRPQEDTLLDTFKRSENQGKPFVVTGNGNVIVNIGRLSDELDELRKTATLIVEKEKGRVGPE